jgi:hypothetical protein
MISKSLNPPPKAIISSNNSSLTKKSKVRMTRQNSSVKGAVNADDQTQNTFKYAGYFKLPSLKRLMMNISF